ncbi:MAG: hypothetical protein JWR35_2683 [Marmoricola sp.]|jgi:hypothetical protein|nr:hypothetical protein [Marmoricola sp.]
MDDPLRMITAIEGVFLRREARELGYDDKAVIAAMRARLWHRVRHGAYCFADDWASQTPEQRHLTLAKAVLRTTPGPVALSHTTALLALGIAVWGADLRRVHVTRLDNGAGRVERDVQHHVGLTSDSELVRVGLLPVMNVARAVLEFASIVSVESGLVSADHALHVQACSADELRARFDTLNHWRGSQKIHVVLHHMDGRAESPGETRSRFMFWRQGLPAPELQFEVYDANGVLIATTDFAWPEHRVFGEFDGRVKYGRYLRVGEEAGDAVFREKRREDLVRAITGGAFGRLVWEDLRHPAETAERFRNLLRRAA